MLLKVLAVGLKWGVIGFMALFGLFILATLILHYVFGVTIAA